MKKQRNCWLYGLIRSAIIAALVLIPIAIMDEVIEPKKYAIMLFSMLSVGTLIFGGIERYYQRHPDKTEE